MKTTKLFLFGAGVLAALTGSGQALAGCWPVWHGLSSHIECDSAGAKPTFKNVKEMIDDMSHASPSCKKATYEYAGSMAGCAGAIYTAVNTGGATIWVGAGEACYEVTESMDRAAEACKTYVNIRTKPVTGKVCNERGEKIFVSIARREKSRKVTSGWYTLENHECRSFSFPNARVLYAMALTTDGGRIHPKYTTNDLNDSATFCINRHKKFDDATPATCNANPSDKPLDYAMTGSWKYTNFGRVSGLSNGFTFR